ncbi:MAG: hypothetical protein ACLR8Y_12360 [Alistipes indistinctus]
MKAEVGYSADDYFNMVYELITNRSDVNLDDLSGTELEAAETALFKEAIAESIRATMWLGDTSRSDTLNTFDGFLKRLTADIGSTDTDIKNTTIPASFTANSDPDAAENLLKQVWNNASELLKAFETARQPGLSGHLGHLCQIRRRDSTRSYWNRPTWLNKTAAKASHTGVSRS